MIWMIIAEVLPDALKEPSASQAASAAMLSVAFMEALGTFFQNLNHEYNFEDGSGFFVSILFGLGPLFGGIILVAIALAFHLQHALLMGTACGIALVLSIWRRVHLTLSSNSGFIPIVLLLSMGAPCIHVSTSSVLKVASQITESFNDLSTLTASPLSVYTLQSFISCGAVAFHALAEGLTLSCCTESTQARTPHGYPGLSTRAPLQCSCG